MCVTRLPGDCHHNARCVNWLDNYYEHSRPNFFCSPQMISCYHLLQSIGVVLQHLLTANSIPNAFPVALSVLRSLCTSSVPELPVTDLHFSLTLCHFGASSVCGKRPYFFILPPGQLQSDAKRFQIAHICLTCLRYHFVSGVRFVNQMPRQSR